MGLDSEWLVGWCCSAPKDAESEQDCWHARPALHKGTGVAAFPACHLKGAQHSVLQTTCESWVLIKGCGSPQKAGTHESKMSDS